MPEEFGLTGARFAPADMTRDATRVGDALLPPDTPWPAEEAAASELVEKAVPTSGSPVHDDIARAAGLPEAISREAIASDLSASAPDKIFDPAGDEFGLDDADAVDPFSVEDVLAYKYRTGVFPPVPYMLGYTNEQFYQDQRAYYREGFGNRVLNMLDPTKQHVGYGDTFVPGRPLDDADD